MWVLEPARSPSLQASAEAIAVGSTSTRSWHPQGDERDIACISSRGPWDPIASQVRHVRYYEQSRRHNVMGLLRRDVLSLHPMGCWELRWPNLKHRSIRMWCLCALVTAPVHHNLEPWPAFRNEECSPIHLLCHCYRELIRFILWREGRRLDLGTVDLPSKATPPESHGVGPLGRLQSDPTATRTEPLSATRRAANRVGCEGNIWHDWHDPLST